MLAQARTKLGDMMPGVLVCATVAIAAQFLSEHYGAPAMLMALLLGIAFHFLGEEGQTVPGIGFSARSVLRFGVALLGARMSVDLLMEVGAPTIALVLLAMAATIAFGLVMSRFLGRNWRMGLLTGSAVAICGASAAMAVAAVLPGGKHAERNLIFTVIGVTVLSTLAMIAYPVLAAVVLPDDRAVGIFLGATIHDVAQVVGAGYSVSGEAGDVATLVKLLRVTMLAPVVVVIALVLRGAAVSGTKSTGRASLAPLFVVGFIALAALNSAALIPEALVAVLVDVSRWALLTGIAAVGMKTSLKSLRDIGGAAIVLIVAETLFIAFVVAGGLHLLG